MKPIQIKSILKTKLQPPEVCTYILDINQWPKFRVCGVLPGIKRAEFERKSKEIVGSRIKVISDNKTTYIEEITEWNASSGVSLMFMEFSPPIKYLTTHFIETIEFRIASRQAAATRTMIMYPRNKIGRLLLIPVSRLM